MGEKRRIKDVSTKYVHRGFPLQVRKYIKHVCHIQGQKELNEKLDEIKNFLINGGIWTETKFCSTEEACLSLNLMKGVITGSVHAVKLFTCNILMASV